MCNDDGCADYELPGDDPAHDAVLNPTHQHVTRRSVLAGLGAIASAPLFLGRAGASASPLSLTGLAPQRLAMHVHASWSEGTASWEAQFAQAGALGLNYLYMTDHDHRMLATRFYNSLAGMPLVTQLSGGFSQQSSTKSGANLRMLAESNSDSLPASINTSIQAKPAAFNYLRTSIAGHSLVVSFGATRIDAGCLYEIVVTLSIHPAFGGRPAGQFELHYRFGQSTTGLSLESGGLIGVVSIPTPDEGTVLTFDLTADVAALWPDMLAIDNSFYLLSFLASSPSQGSVVDVTTGLTVHRTQNDAASVIANQQIIIDTYQPRYPGLAVNATTEISLIDPHVIPFGVAQSLPDQNTMTAANRDAAYTSIVNAVHAQGGLASWNHPFGANTGPLLSTANQAASRRAVFAAMMSSGRYGTDIIEVGYAVRGQVSTATHLDLWDTFSRWGIFLTGNGVNDDHAGLSWAPLTNGFVTAVWATSAAQTDITSGLAAGRAFTYHAGKWPGGAVDLLVDDVVRMGMVSVSDATSRTLAIYAANLPLWSKVEVVSGPVDYAGTDPGTAVVAVVNAATFAASGIASVVVNTAASCFVRVQVRNKGKVIVGISNPVWLLQTPPPSGIPPQRLA